MTRQTRRLRIVVALDATGATSAALDWALALADPMQDELLLVNTYRSIALPDCRWQPVLDANCAQRVNAARSAHAALAAVRRRNREIPAECYTTAANLSDALLELGAVADLVIIHQHAFNASETTHLLRTAPCAVALITGAPRKLDTRPVAIELDRAKLPVELVGFATEIARRRETGLLLAAPFDATGDAPVSADWASSDQRLLGPVLQTLGQGQPDVPVSISVHEKSGRTSTRRLLETSQLLVVPRWDGNAIPLVPSVLSGPTQALLMVPVPAHATIVERPWSLPRPVAAPGRAAESRELAAASHTST